MWNDLSLNGFLGLLVSYFWIVKEGLEKYISSQRKLLRLICRTAGEYQSTHDWIALCTDCRIVLTAGPVTVPHVPGTGMRAAVRFILPSLCQNPHFFQLLHLCASFSVSVTSSLLQLRERTVNCKSLEYVRLLSATLLYQPHLHSRGRLYHSIIIGVIGLRISLFSPPLYRRP